MANHLQLVQPTPTTHTITPEQGIQSLRDLFGRTSAESRWARMTREQRAAVCCAAGLLPSQSADKNLNQFELAEREAIRRAIQNLLALQELWGAAGLERGEWASIKDQQKEEEERRSAIARQASVLAQRRAALQQIAQASGQ